MSLPELRICPSCWDKRHMQLDEHACAMVIPDPLTECHCPCRKKKHLLLSYDDLL